MPIGYPDWGVTKGSIGNYNTDTAELAARLGSIYRVTRTGKILDQSNFIADFNMWSMSTAGTVKKVPYTKDGLFRQGCARLYNLAPSASTGVITRSYPYITGSMYGIECSFREASAGQAKLEVEFTLYDGVNAEHYMVEFAPATHQINAYNASGVITNYATLPTNMNWDFGWATAKVIINLANKTIDRIMLNGVDYITTPINAWIQGFPFGGQICALSYTVTPTGANNLDYRIAESILTFDENEV